MAIMSQRAYARYRGVAVYAVQMAIKTGRISTLQDGQIDSDLADGEWTRNTRTSAPATGRRQTQSGEDDGDAFGASQYTRARAVREHFMAKLAQIEFQEKTGALVRAAEVKIAAFNQFRALRDRLLTLPDRLGAMLAAESDAAKCHEILLTELRKALIEFADGAETTGAIS